MGRGYFCVEALLPRLKIAARVHGVGQVTLDRAVDTLQIHEGHKVVRVDVRFAVDYDAKLLYEEVVAIPDFLHKNRVSRDVLH